LLKELQSLGLDVKVLRDDNSEVEIIEAIDYGDSDYRYEIEGNGPNYEYEKEALASRGFQKQEFDDSGDLVAAATEEEVEVEDEEMDFSELTIELEEV
jgi:DNA-directed RNA polymerase subunit beta